MSLQVWLPLNGTLDNFGLTDLSFKVVNYSNAISSATSGGKVVSGLYKRTTKETADYIISDRSIVLDGDVTMCCWAKVTGIGYSGTANGIFGQHGHLTGGLGITMKDVSSTDLRMSVNTGLYGDSHGSASDRTYCGYYGSTNIYNQWHHLCLTYESKTKRLRMYVDGKPETINGAHSYITLNGNNTTARPIILFAWSTDHLGSGIVNYRPPCELNDVRVYDNVLSVKEIREIAKGLIAHYQLKPTTINNLAKNVGYTIYNNYGVGASLTQLNETYMGYPIYRLTMTPTSSSVGGFQTELWSHGVYQSSWTFNAYTKYCYWIYYRPVSHNDVRVGGVASNIGGWTEIAPQYIENNWYRVGQYRDGSVGSTVSDAIFTSFYSPSAAAGTPISIDFCAPHLVAGTSKIVEIFDSVVPDDGMMHDVSGYGNHLSTAGTPLPSGDSPRYGSCTDFNQSGYFKKADFNMTTNEFTIAFWLNPPYTINAQHFICGTFNSWTGNGFGMWRDSTGGGYSTLYKSNSEGSYTGLPHLNISHDTWNHIAIVYTGRQGILYKNGVEAGRVDGGSSGTVSHPVLYLGNSRYNEVASQTDEASMSDFRFYATALSAADIESLYRVSASAAKDGTLFAYDFSEFSNTAKSSVDKDGTALSCSFNTRNAPVYDMKIKTLDDNSTWARIHYLDVNQYQSYFSGTAEVAKTSKANRFSRMGDVDKFKSQSSLPAGYTELAYIESTGTQYIDTGVAPADNTRVRISYIPTGSLTERSIFGSAWAVNGYFLMTYQGWVRWHSGGSVIDAVKCSSGQRLVIETTNHYLTVNSTRYPITGGANTANNILLLGDMNYNANCRGIGRVEYMQIWQGSTLVRNFVPCKHPSGAVGLYDLVNHNFYGNSGSGSFTAGAYVGKYEFMLTYDDQSQYSRLNYIESTGAQYINTGISNNATQTFKLKMSYEFTTTAPENQIMGFTGNRGMGIGTSGSTWWECYAPSTAVANTLYNIEWTKNPGGGWTRTINGNTNSGDGASDSYEGNLYLFAAHISASEGGFNPQYLCHCKLYNAQIYVDNQLVRDFIPCISFAGRVGLWDKVNNEFYGSNTTTSFVAGPAQYNRWTQTSSPNASSVTDYTPIHIAWPAHSAGIRKHGSSCLYNCDSGDTWYAPIGQYYVWEGGIPAADGTMKKYTELWVRIDKSAETTAMKMYDGTIAAANYFEI